MKRNRILAAGLALVLAAGLALGACGDDDSSSAGPASVVPADAPVYFESVVNLQSEDADGLNEALSTLLGTEDPAGEAISRLEAELEAEGSPVSYEDDIEPLLGDRAALFFQSFPQGDTLSLDTTECLPPEGTDETSPLGATGTEGCALPGDSSDEGDGAFIVETTDEDAARDRIDELFADGGDTAEDASYEGVDYKRNPEGDEAVAVFDGFVVIGTEPAVQAAIDASAGDSLADSDELQSELDGAPDDPVLLAYADVPAALDALEESGQVDSTERGLAEQSLGGIADVPALLTVSADAGSIAMDLSFGIANPEERVEAEESELLRALPGDAWAATAVPNLGAAIQTGIEQFEAGAGSLAPDVEAEFRRETGLDLGDLTAAIGDAAVYVRGTGLFDVGGGAVIEDLDPSATADALEALRRQAQREGEGEVVPLEVDGEGFAVEIADAPQTINVVQRDDRLVIAYGQEATEDAFEPAETLGDSEAFSTAAGALGDDYSVGFYLDVEPPLELAESFGATDDPDYAEAQPYLEHLDYLVTGALSDEDRDRVRVVLGLE